MAIDVSEINGAEVHRLISLQFLHLHHNIITLLVSSAYTLGYGYEQTPNPFETFFSQVIRSALLKMKCVFTRLALERPKPMSRHQKMTWVCKLLNRTESERDTVGVQCDFNLVLLDK